MSIEIIGLTISLVLAIITVIGYPNIYLNLSQLLNHETTYVFTASFFVICGLFGINVTKACCTDEKLKSIGYFNLKDTKVRVCLIWSILTSCCFAISVGIINYGLANGHFTELKSVVGEIVRSICG